MALGTSTEIKRRFSNISMIEVTVKQTRESLLQEVSAIDGVERAEGSVDGLFQKVTVQVKAGADLKDRVVEVIGLENVENSVVRDPTLEEAYLSILG